MEMQMKKNIKLLLTILCLFSTSLVTMATSKKQDGDQSLLLQRSPESLARKDYYIASNCPGAIAQERITVTDERIEYPTNLAYINFGLPTDVLNLTYTNQLSRDMGSGRIRSCTRSEQVDQGTPLIVYTCTETGAFLCQVSFEAVQ